MADCEENGVTHIFEALDNALEFIAIFEARYPNTISTRNTKGVRSDNDACVGLGHFVGRCRIIVCKCMLRGDENISRGVVADYPVCPHLVSLVELHGQIFMFQKL